MASRLSAGQFYGEVALRRNVAGLILTETEYRSDASFPRHSHDLAYFSFLVGGAHHEQVARKEVRYRPFVGNFHPLGEEHSGLVCGGSRLFVMELDQRWVARVPGPDMMPGAGLTLEGDAAVQLAARLFHEFRLDDPCSPLAIEGLACEMLAAAARTRQADTHRPRWLARVEELLREEADGRPDLAHIAEEAGVHPMHVARVFRRCHGTSVGAYLRRLKIEAACAWLARPGASLAEVAVGLGFTDQSHFTRTFKAAIGVTPGRFRDVAVGRRRSVSREASPVQDEPARHA
jgi:AraC family transcriptional regulator